MLNSNAWIKKFCELHYDVTSADFAGLSIAESWQMALEITGLSETDLTIALSESIAIEIATMPPDWDEQIVDTIPIQIARRYEIFPLKISSTSIIVASSHPLDIEMRSVVGFLTNRNIEALIAPPSLIESWINERYSEEKTPLELVIKSREKALGQSNQEVSSNDSAIVSMVSDMLFEAFDLNASDIHVEPFKDGGVLRYRVDGMLRVITELPIELLTPILQRIKVISGLNLANKMIPQDGGASLIMAGQPVDLRVSTIPVKGGEKAVIRLLIQGAVGDIDQIGLPEPELGRFKHLLSHSSGIFIITGPTGSGKSTTLYSALKELNTFDRCLVTVEDPIEYEVDGIAQINVNPVQNVTFNAALRSILRQDPDVILVGEVRDEETAEIALRASITGHFVMTTLHTSDAITTIPRLAGLGIPNTIIADALKGVASQRLVRKLCAHCATAEKANPSSYTARFQALFPHSKPQFALGCESCNHTGYQGRMPLFEIISIDSQLADAIRDGAGLPTLRQLAIKQGNRPMSVIAAQAVSSGETSADEIHRVLGEQFWSDCKRLVSTAK